mgnify:CR=1 FL=1
MSLNAENMLSDIEIDAIGEILNISLGSSATSISGLLDKRVNITTPNVKVMHTSEFEISRFEPAVGVEVNYIKGLEGTNIMVLKEEDVKVIVGILLGTDYSEQEFVMDEMSISAVCEVMNQMMGAAATALSQLLNQMVDISPPNSFPINSSDQLRKKYFSDDSTLVTVSFHLLIADLVDSEFISVMDIGFAKRLVSLFGMSGAGEEEPQSAAVPAEVTFVKQEEAPAMTSQPLKPNGPPRQHAQPSAAPAPAPAPAPSRTPKTIRRAEEPAVQHTFSQATYNSFDEDIPSLSEDQNNNLNLIMSVPLQITVEIGRTVKKIKDILDFGAGSIIELNKQAGTQVDIFVNGQQIAKGDVIVVDDYYGVKITEISSNSEILKLI